MQANRKFIIAVLVAAVAIVAAWGASVPRTRSTRGNRTAAAGTNAGATGRTANANAAAKPAEGAMTDEDGPKFTDFNLIMSRNVFNASRRAGETRRQAVRTSDTAPVVDTIDLLGVMIDAHRAVAFTEGSRQDYTQTLKPGETFAGLKVAAISTDGLKLEGTSQTIALWQVGTRLYRRENDEWRIGESPRFNAPQIQSTRQNNQPRQSAMGGGRGSSQGRGGFGGFNSGFSGNNSGYGRDSSSGQQGGRSRGRNQDGGGGQTQTGSSSRAAAPQATPGATSGASAAEILARMREQRRREMGQ